MTPARRGQRHLVYLDREGWLHLAVVIDLFARRAAGWPWRIGCIGSSPWPPSARTSSYAPGPRADPSCRPWQPVLLHGLPGRPSKARPPDLDMGHGDLLPQHGGGAFFKTLKSELVWRTVFEIRHKASRPSAATSTASTPCPAPLRAPNRKPGLVQENGCQSIQRLPTQPKQVQATPAEIGRRAITSRMMEVLAKAAPTTADSHREL
jgi:hypothetical protein